MTARVGIVGGAGYVGGELMRLLVRHPEAEIAYVASRSRRGELVYRVHPNLRPFLNLRFRDVEVSRISDSCDVVFLCYQHGSGLDLPPALLEVGVKVIDLSANYRLRDPALYRAYYGFDHPHPELLGKRVYGLPELHREEIAGADFVSVPGCIATASILALAPLVGKLGLGGLLFSHAMIGSTAAGSLPSPYTHHPERANVIRPYKIVDHRHVAEINQELRRFNDGIEVVLSAYAVDVVRGLLFGCQIPLDGIEARDVWGIYRGFYGGEPFVVLLKDPRSVIKLPDPKISVGTNFCYIGFEMGSRSPILAVVSALDNLVKGGAGNAVQCLNLMLGVDEKTALFEPAPHPA